MKHLNGDLLCAVDIETTGLDSTKHEIYQIAILPLNGSLKTHAHHRIFDIVLRPDNVDDIDWEGMDKNNNRKDVLHALTHGIDQSMGAELLVDWFERLRLPEKKRIVPLAHNWAGIDREFIGKWLGPLTYQSIFHFHYRDLMSAALYLNDRADAQIEQVPFPKVSLQYLCSQLGIERNGRAHTALDDCVVTAECYKKLLTTFTI